MKREVSSRAENCDRHAKVVEVNRGKPAPRVALCSYVRGTELEALADTVVQGVSHTERYRQGLAILAAGYIRQQTEGRVVKSLRLWLLSWAKRTV